MHRAWWTSLGTMATAGFLVLSVLAMLTLGAGGLHAVSVRPAHLGLATERSTPTHFATHATGPRPAVVTGVTLNSSDFHVYTALPVWLNWTVAGSGINATNTAQNVQFLLLSTPSQGPSFAATTVANVSVPVNSSTPGNGSLKATYTLLQTTTPFSGGNVPEGQYQIFVWVQDMTTGTFYVSSVTTNLGTHPVSGKILNPGKSPVGTGTVTIAGEYNGSFVTGANVSVFLGTTLVFIQGVLAPSAVPNQQQGWAVNWNVSVTGNYTLKYALTATYGSVNYTQPINVSTAVTGGQTPVYLNHTVYNNASIPGFGPGGTAALLIVVGLIVGMIVGLALGRAMMGGTRTTTVQAWKPTTECPVCHQTFPTEADLADHQKTAHGMTSSTTTTTTNPPP